MGGGPLNRTKELGTALGQAFVHQANALSKARIRAAEGETGCDREATKKSRPAVCNTEDEIVDVLERIDEAEQAGQLPNSARYEDTHSFYMFQVLTGALSSGEPLVRWNILERIRWLCDNKTLLADAADKPCESEVEQACLKLLSSDGDSENRRLALEILSSGYATVRSEAAVEMIFSSADEAEERELAAKVLKLLESRKQ